MKTNQSPTRCLKARLSSLLILQALAGVLAVHADSSDDFNDNSKSTSKWGKDRKSGRGILTEINQRLEYTCVNPTIQDEVNRPWILTRFPYTADWEIQMDFVNRSTPSTFVEVNSMGFDIVTTKSTSDNLFVELYSSALSPFPGPSVHRTGFLSELDSGDDTISVDTHGGMGITNAAIRVTFDSLAKVLTVYVDTEVSDGYQWEQQASIGIAGSGGMDGNGHWGLSDSDQFAVSVYGYSSLTVVSSDQVYTDNFSESGGVASSGQAIPDPTGSFEFQFPTDNPLIRQVLSVAGNYSGLSPTIYQRPYSLDVAEDESGKLMVMGTIDGIEDSSGNTTLSAPVGAIKTVNNEPTVQLKGSFAGVRDGAAMTFSGSAVVPVEVVDIGGGTNGVSGTGSYKAKVGGVPAAGKNLPILVEAPPGATNNVNNAWSLRLDLARKEFKGKEKTVAIAQLTLPNGDTISYPEKIVKYSASKGYTLSFKKGTNVTAAPPRIDKKSSVAIKRLTFARQGDQWTPTGGVITYQFLGQKGIADLMAFVSP